MFDPRRIEAAQALVMLALRAVVAYDIELAQTALVQVDRILQGVIEDQAERSIDAVPELEEGLP